MWSARTQVIPRRDDGNPDKGLSAVSCADRRLRRDTQRRVGVLVGGAVPGRGGTGRAGARGVVPDDVALPAESGYASPLTFDALRCCRPRRCRPASPEWTGLSCPSATFCAVVGTAPPTCRSRPCSTAVVDDEEARRRGHRARRRRARSSGACVAVGDGGTYRVLASGAWSATRTSAALGSGSNLPKLDRVSAQWCLSDGGDGDRHASTARRGRWSPEVRGSAGDGAGAVVRVDDVLRPRESGRRDPVLQGLDVVGLDVDRTASGIFSRLSCSSAANRVGTDLDGAARQRNGSTWSTPLALGLNRGRPVPDRRLVPRNQHRPVVGPRGPRGRARRGGWWSAPASLEMMSCREGVVHRLRPELAGSSSQNGAWSAPVRLPGADGRGRRPRPLEPVGCAMRRRRCAPGVERHVGVGQRRPGHCTHGLERTSTHGVRPSSRAARRGS